MILNREKTLNALYDVEDIIMESVGCTSPIDCDTCEHRTLCYFIADLRDKIFHA